MFGRAMGHRMVLTEKRAKRLLRGEAQIFSIRIACFHTWMLCYPNHGTRMKSFCANQSSRATTWIVARVVKIT